MPKKPYKPSMSMPLPTSPTIKVESPGDRVESGASRAQNQSSGKYEQENTRKHSGLSSLGGGGGPAPKKGRYKAPQRHAEHVESALKQYEEDIAEQGKEEDEYKVEVKEEEEEEEQEYYGLGVSSFWPWKADSQNAKHSHSDNSALRTGKAAGSGSQLGAGDQGFRSHKYLQEVEPSHSDFVSRTWGATGSGSQQDADVQEISRNEYLQEVKHGNSDSVSRPWEAAGSGSQLRASVQDFPRNRSSCETHPNYPGEFVSRAWVTEGPGGTGGQLGANVKSGRQKETPAEKWESLYADTPLIDIDMSLTGPGGTGGQLGAKVTSARFKDKPAKKPEPQPARRPKSDRPKERPAREPDPLFWNRDTGSESEIRLHGREGTDGQLGARVTSARFKDKPPRKPKSPSSRSKVHSENPVKGPAAGSKDTSQAPTKP